jgi:DNA-binding SARP family transcriptional activator
MAGIADVVQHTPGAVFAVDERLKIVAWNEAAERALGVVGAEALGTTCYETVPAVDADTGRPCYEQCPLLSDRPWHGWVHSRVLKAGWSGQEPIRLDCMLLRCVLPSSEHGTLSFMTPLGAVDAEKYLRLLSTLESLYPIMSRSVDLEQSLAGVLRAVLQATDGVSSELIVLAPDAGPPALVLRQSSDPEVECSRALGPDHTSLLDLVADAAGALVVLRPPGQTPDAGPGERWCLAAPVVADDRLLAVLTVGSHDADFSISLAARVVFAVAAQLSVFLRWALPSDATGTSPTVAVAQPERPTLQAHCFGRFRVALDGVEIPPSRFKRQKSLTLLKLLAAHRGRPFRREALMELLWPEAEPGLSSNHLRVVLHDLRRALEPDLRRGQPSAFIASRGDLVYVDPASCWWVDVEELERLAGVLDAEVARGRIDEALAAGRAAVALYTGDFLEDEPYDDWCLAERERLRERYLDLLLRLSGLLAGRALLAEAVDVCRLALAADPLRERTHRLLMELLWQHGDRDAALRQYESCRRMLRDELDVAPDQETQTRYRAILGSDGTTPQPTIDSSKVPA